MPIVHPDGTVTTIYNRATSESFSYFTGGGETNTNAVVERSNQTGDSVTPAGTTTYFLADQIHSTRMTLAYGGWPMTQDTFYPFGVEPTPPADPNHYKFSGKERDAASGLDNFGARYYSAVMGRFMTPDWSASPEPVPYAKLDNPQSLNLYTYVENNPLTRIDADGHDPYATKNGAPCDDQDVGVQTAGTGIIVNKHGTCATSAPGMGVEIQHAWHEALSYFYIKGENGQGIGLGDIKVGPMKVAIIQMKGKVVTQTIDGKKEESVDEVGLKVGVGGIKFGLSRKTTQEEGKAPKTETLKIFSLGKFEGENAQIGVGFGGCIFACGQIELGIQADKVWDDLSEYIQH